MMRLGTMFDDIVRAFFHKPVTELYPFEKRETPARTRGMLHWNPENCTGCSLCVKDCPANAIELVILDRQEKRFVMHYYADRCTFCGQCVMNCRFNCLKLVHDEWELASAIKDQYKVTYGKEEDVAEAMA